MRTLQCPEPDPNFHQPSQNVSLQIWSGALLGIHKMPNGAFSTVLLVECVLIGLRSAHLFFPLDQAYMQAKETVCDCRCQTVAGEHDHLKRSEVLAFKIIGQIKCHPSDLITWPCPVLYTCTSSPANWYLFMASSLAIPFWTDGDHWNPNSHAILIQIFVIYSVHQNEKHSQPNLAGGPSGYKICFMWLLRYFFPSDLTQGHS